MNENREWVSKTEAATALGVSTRQIKRYIDTGRLVWERDRLSGRVLISLGSVKALRKQRGHLREVSVV